MTILHANILDADRHEPKGISTAALGSVYVANGSGAGTWKNTIVNYTASLSPSIVTANTTVEQAFTVSGVTAADTCISVVKPTAQAGLGIVGWRITTADTIGIVFSNNTGASITPTATQTYIFTVLKA